MVSKGAAFQSVLAKIHADVCVRRMKGKKFVAGADEQR